MNDSSTFRAFIAIELSEAIRRELDKVSKELRQKVPPKTIRWVPTENIHLSLKFLGETRIEDLTLILEGMDRIVSNFSKFEIVPDKLGCFPNVRRPRVLWVGVKGDVDSLLSVQLDVEMMLEPFGWKPERRNFHPHLTLGRVKNRNQVVESNLPWGRVMQPTSMPVNAITLFESHLKPSGAIYSVRHVSRF